jgi:hypothetical protein
MPQQLLKAIRIAWLYCRTDEERQAVIDLLESLRRSGDAA